MVSLLEAVFLGIVQGLTEWLPISSSGHLVIVQQLLKIEVPLFFYVLLHFGTLLAVIVLFWRDILKILKSLIKLDFKSESGIFAKFIIIGSIPVFFVGFFFRDLIKLFFENLFLVGISLITTGILLYMTKSAKSKRDLSFSDSILTGFAQALSLVPGISRSGSIISMGLLREVKKETIFKFSFLLSIPAVIGANVLELRNLILSGIRIDLLSMVLGTGIAAVVGYLSLKFLFRILVNGKFYLFSYYCWVVGVIVIILSLS